MADARPELGVRVVRVFEWCGGAAALVTLGPLPALTNRNPAKAKR